MSRVTEGYLVRHYQGAKGGRDAALLDMHMHVMTGLEAVQILRRLRALLPCILISADADESLQQAAAEVSAYRVLKKPVARNELLETISTALCDRI